VKKAESHGTANQQVHFESEPRGERKIVSVDMHEDGSRVSRFARESKHTTSAPTSSGQDQRLREEFEGVSTIKEIRPVSGAPRRQLSLGQRAVRIVYRNHPDSSEDEGESHLAVLRPRRGEDQSASSELRRMDVLRNLERWE
jgi:hypothetical protein